MTGQKYVMGGELTLHSEQTAKKRPKFTLLPDKRPIPIPLDLAPELWRPVIGFEDRYQVSSKGQVKSLSRQSGNRFIRGKLLLFQLNNKCYQRTALYDGEKPRFLLVHRLVAFAFIANPLSHPEVNHKDLNPQNNAWANLEWITKQGNIHHAVQHYPQWGAKPKVVPDHIVTQILSDYYTVPKWFTIQQLSLTYRLSTEAVKKILRQYCKSNRHSQQVRQSIIADYRVRKAIGLTTSMVAQRYGISIHALRGIVRRTKQTSLTSQTSLSYD